LAEAPGAVLVDGAGRGGHQTQARPGRGTGLRPTRLFFWESSRSGGMERVVYPTALSADTRRPGSFSALHWLNPSGQRAIAGTCPGRHPRHLERSTWKKYFCRGARRSAGAVLHQPEGSFRRDMLRVDGPTKGGGTSRALDNQRGAEKGNGWGGRLRNFFGMPPDASKYENYGGQGQAGVHKKKNSRLLSRRPGKKKKTKRAFFYVTRREPRTKTRDKNLSFKKYDLSPEARSMFSKGKKKTQEFSK